MTRINVGSKSILATSLFLFFPKVKKLNILAIKSAIIYFFSLDLPMVFISRNLNIIILVNIDREDQNIQQKKIGSLRMSSRWRNFGTVSNMDYSISIIQTTKKLFQIPGINVSNYPNFKISYSSCLIKSKISSQNYLITQKINSLKLSKTPWTYCIIIQFRIFNIQPMCILHIALHKLFMLTVACVLRDLRMKWQCQMALSETNRSETKF